MTIKLGLNIASLKAQRQLGKATEMVSVAFERLSSGMRINKASDDAAGIAIATQLKSDVRVYSQAIRNVNDGISALNIADGALGALSDITIRQKELAVQASSGTYSLAQRQVMHTEANALADEFNRIIEQTQFNGIKLLDLSNQDLSIQAGSGSQSTLTLQLGDSLARSVGSGSFTSGTAYTVGSAGAPYNLVSYDFNRDGYLDIVTGNSLDDTIAIAFGNGNGTFKSVISYASGDRPQDLKIGDINRDGIQDLVTADYDGNTVSVILGNSDGTFKAVRTYSTGSLPYGVEVADLNNDGYEDVIAVDYGTTLISVFLANSDGSLRARTSLSIGAQSRAAYAADFNGDGNIDIATLPQVGALTIKYGNGNGTFKANVTFSLGGGGGVALDGGDINNDGILDLIVANGTNNTVDVFLGNSDGSFKARSSYEPNTGLGSVVLGDMNGDGYLDFISTNPATSRESISLGNGDGSFKLNVSYATGFTAPTEAVLGDFNRDGIPDVVSVSQTGGRIVFQAGIATSTTLSPHLNLLSASNAQSSLAIFDSALDRISLERANIGAYQSRLTSTLNTLSTTRTNYEAAASRITDVDVAEETSALVRATILQKAGSAILAQANQTPVLALQLLKNS